MTSPIDNGVVLITGASSGIGRELALLLAKRAKSLIVVARRKDRLAALKDELLSKNPHLNVVLGVCDLSDVAQAESMIRDVTKEAGAIDVLVNNAGLGDIGVFDFATWEKTRRMIDVNVMTLTYLTLAVLGPMVKKGTGGILNVSSGWGLTFGPGLTVYNGTKHYVTGFTESLRLDLAGTGVFVTQICPGPVATEFEEVAGNFTGQKIPAFIQISAQQCAKSAIRAFDKRKPLVVPGLLMKAVMWITRMTPRFMLRLVLAPVGKRLRKQQNEMLKQASPS